MTYNFRILSVVAAVVVSAVVLALSFTTSSAAGDITHSTNLQTLVLEQPLPSARGGAIGGPIIDIVGDAAVVAPEGARFNEADDDHVHSHQKQASIYVVRDGDTLGEVAEMFDVSVDTIVWANDLGSNESINPGDILVILPVSGVRHEVEEGDTLESIAAHYDSTVEKIRDYNDLDNDDTLAVGAIVDIPGGKMPKAETNSSRKDTQLAAGAITTGNTPVGDGFFINPVPGSVVTQRLHGYNAVDFASSNRSSILAAASGNVIKSVPSGWNGGYGHFILIEHDNGVRTLYSHLSSVIVSRGQRVVQGQVIGYQGSTGRSTGPHLHFEVRGTTNPFASCGVRTACGS